MPRAACIAVVPARGGSKGIPRKNLADFLGGPLFLWQARACADSGVFDAVVVSSDDCEVLDAARAAGFLAHERSAEASSDGASSETAVAEAAAWYRSLGRPVDVVCLAQPTSPLTASEDYAAAWTAFEDAGADSLVTVCRRKVFLWRQADEDERLAQPANYDPRRRPRRQDWDGVLVENGAFYFTRSSLFDELGCRLGGRTVAYQMEEWKATEIDTPEDLEVCRAIGLARGLKWEA
ncbi:nucleotide-diphospho-sugar transferase [Hyaloraphidium curvatum]|nr:nucleotide-diphospho-sugar transferase [Hyaloraphidium curvatum]